jgi:hypothetical protein
VVDHHVDRPGVEVPRGMELTGTNRSIGLIVLSKTHERFDVSDNDVFSNLIFLVDLVVLPRSPHPIPFRTRSLSSSGPMVLRLKARESRSPPGLPSRSRSRTLQFTMPFDSFAAGWSSPVARQAHNLKVTGSNPVPAPKFPSGPASLRGRFRFNARMGGYDNCIASTITLSDLGHA